MRGVGWSGRVAALCLTLCGACGGKAAKEEPVVSAPTAGGVVGAGGAGGASAPTTGGVRATAGGVAQQPEPGTELWLPRGYTVLTPEFYHRLLTDVFAVTAVWPNTVSGTGESFRLTRTAPSASVNETLQTVAEQVVARLTDEVLLGAAGCGGGHTAPVVDLACAENVSNGFARRMWRREVTAAESAELMALFSEAAPGAEIEAVREMVRAVLVAPDAYTLPTLGTEAADGSYRLTDLELAGWLALGITGMPDDELIQAAIFGQFELETAIERVLGSDGARRRITTLIRKWFGVRDPEQLWLFPDSSALALIMHEETRRFIESVVFDEPRPLSSLVTADFSFVDSSLALLYGLDYRGSDYARVDLGGTRRRGIPGQASYLVSTSFETGPSFVQRAQAPLELLCEELPPPEPTVTPPTPPGEGSRRERFEELTGAAACRGCHAIMNPLAFAFDHFDQQGVYVELDDAGFPIDSSGSLVTARGSSLEFADSAELMQELAETQQYSECFLQNAVGWLSGLGEADPAVLNYVARGHEPGDDEPVLVAIRKFLQSDHFRYRKQ